MKKTQSLNNEKGMIAVDFMFAFVLVCGMTFIVWALCFALVGVEITQYIAFATARTYSAAHRNPTDQIAQGQRKYAQLINDPVFKPLFRNGLFEVPDPNAIFIGNMESVYQKNDNKYQFWGVYLTLNVPMLDFRIPLYGSTMGPSDGGDGFFTNIGAFLGREVTFDECHNFTQSRWRNIRNFADPYPGGDTNYPADKIAYYDNGC